MSKKIFFSGSETKVLIIRPDRLGDVILSLGVARALKKHWPELHGHGCHVTFMVRPELVEFLKKFSDLGIDEFLPVPTHFLNDHSDTDMAANAWDEFIGVKSFSDQLKDFGFEVAVSLQVNPKIALALRLAKIPLRVGPYSKLISFLCFNRGVKQSRSQVKMHEADYNLDCLSPLDIHVTSRDFPPRLRMPSTEVAPLDGRHYAVIHSGMGGSAVNWSEENYSELGALLLEKMNVVLTSGPKENERTERIFKSIEAKNERLSSGSSRSWHELSMALTPSLWDLAKILHSARLLVAPSTGPLHLASALGTKVIGLYPSIKVQSAKRWGPLNSKTGELAEFFEPSARTPLRDFSKGELDGTGTSAEMDRITPLQVYEKVLRTLGL